MEKIEAIGFLGALGRTSIQAGILVLVVLVAQWVFRNQLTPRWRCSLWLLVVLRLLLPVSFASAVSIFNLLPHLHNQAEGSLAPPRQPLVAYRKLEVSQPDQIPPGITHSTPDRQFSEPAGVPGKSAANSALPATSSQHSSRGMQHLLRKPTLAEMLFWGWLAGVVGLSGYVLVSSLKLAKTLARLRPISDPHALAALAGCRTRLKVRTALELVENSALGSPALYGIFRPRLVLPVGFTDNFSERELRFIFLHELAHLKRLDLPMNWVIAVLQVLHWFNPLVWVGFGRWRVDRELACDAMALDAVGAEQSEAYGQTILRLLAGLTRPAITPGLVGILETKQQLRRRIGMIATYVPGPRWQVLALVVATVLGVIGLTDAQNKSSESKPGNMIPSSTVSGTVTTKSAAVISPRPVITNGPTIRVIVVDAETSKPLVGAHVLAPNQAAFFSGKENAPQWLSDKDGVAIVHLGEIPSNHLSQQSWFTVSVRHKGYAPHGMSWSAENKDVRPELPGEITVRLKRGISVGGVVKDEQGAPVSGLQVRLFGTGYWEGLKHEYPEYWTGGPGLPQALTDANGHWQAEDFPADLDGMIVELIPPDGASQRFRKAYVGWEQDPRETGEPINLEELRAGKAVFVLRSGLNLKGVVLDPQGQPLRNVLVKAGTGAVNMQRLPDFRTDADGRFHFSHLLRHQLMLTAYPNKFAITSLVADVTPNTPEIRLRLTPLRPLRIHVLDGKGQAAPGAKVTVDAYRTEGQVLDFAGEADQNGILIWTNAPMSSFALTASSPSRSCRQKIRVVPSQQEITFRLREGMTDEVVITGRARDAKTGAPVKIQSVSYKTDFKGFELSEETRGREFRLTIPAKIFTSGGMYPSYQLQLAAEGYALLITDSRDFDEGDWDAEFVMQPASESSRTILQPDGEPAAGARVWIRANLNDGPLFCNQPNQYDGSRLLRLQTDVQGKFALPGLPEDQILVLTHPQGCLEISRAELERQSLVKLQPWGRVEGVTKIGGQPKGGVQLGLSTLWWSPYNHGMLLNYSTTSAADGTFAFTNVPAGEYKLCRYPAVRVGRSMIEDHQTPVVVNPGETARVDYGGEGRAVIGQAKSDNPDLMVDWLNDNHTLTLKQPTIKPLSIEEFASSKAFHQAYSVSYTSPERLALARAARTYQLSFDQDGSFRADDVPVGAYELRISVNKPGEQENFGALGNPKADLGSLVRDVVVPPGHQPFDIGTLIVPMKPEAGAKKTEAVNLVAQGLDGQSVNLRQFKGRHVLLAFWGSWSERSVERLAELQQIQAQFAKDSRIDFLAISVDPDIADVRKALETHHSSWTQAWVPPDKATKLTAAFDVNSLPTVFLIDPDGRIVGRDLEGDRLKTSVRRALAAK